MTTTTGVAMPEHEVESINDDGDILVLCQCGWGYACPDEATAQDVIAQHLSTAPPTH